MTQTASRSYTFTQLSIFRQAPVESELYAWQNAHCRTYSAATDNPGNRVRLHPRSDHLSISRWQPSSVYQPLLAHTVECLGIPIRISNCSASSYSGDEYES
jgi:hypothetical protein